MKASAILGIVCSVVLITGCDDTRSTASTTPPTPGSYQSGGGLSPFYAEEVHDNRMYVFSTKKTWQKFTETKDMDPLNSKRLIGKGPNNMTLIVETSKDEPAKDKRILKTVASRYNLTL